MKPRITTAYLPFLFLLLISICCNGTGPKQPLTEKVKQSTIEEISKILSRNYVYPEVASEMIDFLKKNLSDGAYNALTDLDTFGSRITTDLQSISHDKHLRVWSNSGEQLKQRNNGGRFQRNVNHGFYEVKVLEGNIGYIDLRAFSGSRGATAVAEKALEKVSGTETLIIDLRKNGGGVPEMIRTLTSYFFDGKESVHLNTFYWRPTDSYQEFYTSTSIDGKRMDNTDIYILTSKYTFSAAEEFTYNLKHLERATVVGETTGGGAHPGGMQRINAQFTMFVPQGRAINPITKTNWEGTGIEPHVFVEPDRALEKALELIKSNK